MLLSIIESVEVGEILQNKIYITSDLVARFKDTWHRLVANKSFTANFSLPFYHLQSDRFWSIKTLAGREIALTTSNSIKSFSNLKEVVDYAFFDPFLFELLLETKARDILRNTLLSNYFQIYSLEVPYQVTLLEEIKNEILYEAPVLYKTRANTFNDEEVFIRSGVFKKVIPQIYNYSCCISGMRIIASREVQMIDACHIVPFSESHDDTISNGISLCPNLHRAFDRGLIAIDENYRVLISNTFSERTVDYSIKQYEGKPLLLPQHPTLYPLQENLNWHQVNVFKL